MTVELVGYDYIAAGLGVAVQSARIYRGRHDDYPVPVDAHSRSPLFDRKDADRYIAAHRTVGARPHPSPLPLSVAPAELVGYDYVAGRLRVGLKTVYQYGSPTSARHIPRFPLPVTPPAVRQPLFRREDVDRFVCSRIARSRSESGRLRAAAITEDARWAAARAAALLGHQVDLEDLPQLRQVLFVERRLPATVRTSRGPSVSTAQLKRLYREHRDPFLREVLAYRGVEVDEAGGIDDWLDAAAQPVCPECGVVMRPGPGEDVCPACGRRSAYAHTRMPKAFPGPAIHGG